MKLFTVMLLMILTSNSFAGTRDSIAKIESRLDELEKIVHDKVVKYNQIAKIDHSIDAIKEFLDERDIGLEVESNLTDDQKTRLFATIRSCVEEIEKKYPHSSYYHRYSKFKLDISDYDSPVEFVSNTVWIKRSKFRRGDDFTYSNANQCYTLLASRAIFKKE